MLRLLRLRPIPILLLIQRDLPQKNTAKSMNKAAFYSGCGQAVRLRLVSDQLLHKWQRQVTKLHDRKKSKLCFVFGRFHFQHGELHFLPSAV